MDDDLPPELTVGSIGAVRVVTSNRPDKLNAVSQPVHRALEHVYFSLQAEFESFGTEQAKLTAERLLSRSKKD